MKRLLPLLCLTPLLATAQPLSISKDLGTIFQFEESAPQLTWLGATIDDQVAHGGKRSARITRQPDATGQSTSITMSVPLDVKGQIIQWRGYLKTSAVQNYAALWIRQDGGSGVVAFQSMPQGAEQGALLQGDTDWTRHSVQFALDPSARALAFGVILAGPGSLWIDDLELLVDGSPIWEAPKAQRQKTVLDSDQEFDQGSQSAISTLSPVQIGNLATLGKVWGFAKYHHPRVTAGELHWDYELFRVLPAVLAAANRDAGNTAVYSWLQGLGELKPCDPCAGAELDRTNIHFAPNLAWISSQQKLGVELSDLLRQIHARRPPDGKQFFVGLPPHSDEEAGNPDFDIERAYPEIKLPDSGYQLLALFRFWNIIEYWFPYRDLIGEDWDAALSQLIPRLALARDKDQYELELLAMIVRASDTHAKLWSNRMRPPVGACGIPATFRFVENQAVVTHAGAGGLAVGDIVTHLDGVAVTELVRRWSPYYSGSNEATRLRNIARSFGNGACGEAQLTVDREGEKRSATATRSPPARQWLAFGFAHDRPGAGAFQRLSNDVAYLKMSAVNSAEIAEYLKLATGSKGWIIDSRNYPSDFVPFVLGALFVDQPTPFVRFTVADGKNPGAFRFDSSLRIEPAKTRYPGKVIILMDEVSQSSSEYHAMALRAGPRAQVIGSTTAAADGNVSAFALPGGHRTMISGIGVFYPDKRPTQRIGIVPDIEVKPTIKGIREGRDEALDRAIKEIVGR